MPGMVQRVLDGSQQAKYRVKDTSQGLVYSFVSGEGPGENTLEEMDQKCQVIPQEEFLAQLRGAKLAEARTEGETKRELPASNRDAPNQVGRDADKSASSPNAAASPQSQQESSDGKAAPNVSSNSPTSAKD